MAPLLKEIHSILHHEFSYDFFKIIVVGRSIDKRSPFGHGPPVLKNLDDTAKVKQHFFYTFFHGSFTFVVSV